MLSNIYLIGPRACGKTSVGRILADKLNFKFYDTDEVLVRKAGCDIAQYVEQKGWNGFRDLEAEVLGELSKKIGRSYPVGVE
nr:shikimate kinase [Maridesulfovibrio sp.]